MSSKAKLIVLAIAAVLIVGGAGWIIYRSSANNAGTAVGAINYQALKVTDIEFTVDPEPVAAGNFTTVLQEVRFNRDFRPGETATVRFEVFEDTLADDAITPSSFGETCQQVEMHVFDCTFTRTNVPKTIQINFDMEMRYTAPGPHYDITIQGSARGTGFSSYPYLDTIDVIQEQL